MPEEGVPRPLREDLEGLGPEPSAVLDGARDLGLATRYVGRTVHHLRSVDSTSNVLRSLAADGAAAGTVVLADEQDAGRGRTGRKWYSPDGLGVWMSVLLRSEMSAERLAPLSIAAAVSLAEALRILAGLNVRVKWPNDLLVDGRKLGGLLVESAQMAGESVQSAVLGIGLNVGLDESDLPPELVGVATSLRIELGRSVTRLEVLRATLPALEECFDRFEREGIAGFRERWRGLSSTLGREVTITPGAAAGSAVSGTVTDLSESGALVLEDAEGGRQDIWFGDITLRHVEAD
ncbi:MAG: biotin--[acetyl-CoA-carboxylase] ligase [Candidatus Eisenbacteria bacterium]